MATQRPGFEVPLTEFSASLLSQQEVQPRAQLTAQQIAALLPDTNVIVYTLEQVGDERQWSPKAVHGEINVQDQAVAFESGTLGAMVEKNEVLLFTGSELDRGDYAHLDTRRTVVSLAVLPLAINDQLMGAIELISYAAPLTEEALTMVVQVAEVASLALANSIAYENERNNQLESVARLTEFWDFEKIVNSIMEMDDLMPLIASKVGELMLAQAVNLYLQQGDELLLVQQYGNDPTVEVGTTFKPLESIAGDVAENGQPVAITDAEDARLVKRNNGLTPEEGGVFSLIAVPLVEQSSLVGAVEVVNRRDGAPFDDDDEFALNTFAEAAAGALRNASLLEAERKIEYLQTLVKVSQEISSTLNLDRVLKTVVNAPQAVIPFERASIALERHGRLQLKAISGIEHFVPGEPGISTLDDILQWASISDDEVYITERDGEIDDDREETKAKFKRYFAETGMKSFYAMPLLDEQGRVGIYALESSDPAFLNEAHFELIKIIVGQATVALRNAAMFKEVPFIGILEPILQRKNKFLALEKNRQRTYAIFGIAAAVFLAVIPLPMRVDGDAVVAPARTAQIQPQVPGVVKSVYVREGDSVRKGTILADLDDTEYRAAFAAAQAQYATAGALMNKALASGDGSEAGVQKVQTDYWAAEVQRAKHRLDAAHLTSPIDGIVTTPHIESFVGKRLELGDNFGEVVDTQRATVDVALEESDIGLLQPGSAGAVKLEAFPTRKFSGTVSVLSPKSQAEGEKRVYYARVDVDNPDGVLRPGMQGRGKLSVGLHQSGFILLRGPAMWFRTKLWNWFGI